MFEWAGGLPALTRMTRLFYEKYVPQDPLLAPLFATMSADHPERVAEVARRGILRAALLQHGVRRLHPHDLPAYRQGPDRGAAGALGRSCSCSRARRPGLPADPEFRSAFSAYIEWGSRLALENSQPGAQPPEHMPMPRWDWSTAAGPPGGRDIGARPGGGRPTAARPCCPPPARR